MVLCGSVVVWLESDDCDVVLYTLTNVMVWVFKVWCGWWWAVLGHNQCEWQAGVL